MKNHEYQKGDKVTLEISGHTASGKPLFRAKSGGSDLAYGWLNLEAIHVHNHESAPRPLQVGDKVTLENGTEVREIKAIVGDMAWVTSLAVPNGGIVRSLANLKRITIN